MWRVSVLWLFGMRLVFFQKKSILFWFALLLFSGLLLIRSWFMIFYMILHFAAMAVEVENITESHNEVKLFNRWSFEDVQVWISLHLFIEPLLLMDFLDFSRWDLKDSSSMWVHVGVSDYWFVIKLHEHNFGFLNSKKQLVGFSKRKIFHNVL